MTRMRHILALVTTAVLAVLLVGCQGNSAQQASSSTEGAAFDPPAELVMPQVSASAEDIDISHIADGYVVAHVASASRVKFQVASAGMTYNYDLANDGTPSVFPLNMGDGDYLFRIMKNTSGNDYVEAQSVEASVKLASEFAPFIIPNQYCNYDETSDCVTRARELTADADNQGEAVKRICEFVIDNISYDTTKAARLSNATGYIPNPDDTLASGTGICFDYASLGAAMLRSVGFPTKIITGYVSSGEADDLYHAWIMVYVDGSWHTGEFSVNADEWSRVDLTFAASGSTEFTGDGASYTERYIY